MMWSKTPAADYPHYQLRTSPTWKSGGWTDGEVAQSTLDALCFRPTLCCRDRCVQRCHIEQDTGTLVGQGRKGDRRLASERVESRERQVVRERQGYLDSRSARFFLLLRCCEAHVGRKLGREKRQLRMISTSPSDFQTGQVMLTSTYRIRPLTISGWTSAFASTQSFRIPTKVSTSFLNASGWASRKWFEM